MKYLLLRRRLEGSLPGMIGVKFSGNTVHNASLRHINKKFANSRTYTMTT